MLFSCRVNFAKIITFRFLNQVKSILKPFDSSTLAVKDNFPSALGTDDLDEGGKRFWPIDAASNPVGDVIVERAAVTQNVTQKHASGSEGETKTVSRFKQMQQKTKDGDVQEKEPRPFDTSRPESKFKLRRLHKQ